jgi:hypothetical protein
VTGQVIAGYAWMSPSSLSASKVFITGKDKHHAANMWERSVYKGLQINDAIKKWSFNYFLFIWSVYDCTP